MILKNEKRNGGQLGCVYLLMQYSSCFLLRVIHSG